MMTSLTVAVLAHIDLALEVLNLGELRQHLGDVAGLAGDRLVAGAATAAVLVAVRELE